PQLVYLLHSPGLGKRDPALGRLGQLLNQRDAKRSRLATAGDFVSFLKLTRLISHCGNLTVGIGGTCPMLSLVCARVNHEHYWLDIPILRPDPSPSLKACSY